jgi:hypothetical protein
MALASGAPPRSARPASAAPRRSVPQTTREDAVAISKLCTAAGRPELAVDFILRGRTADEVRAVLAPANQPGSRSVRCVWPDPPRGGDDAVANRTNVGRRLLAREGGRDADRLRFRPRPVGAGSHPRQNAMRAGRRPWDTDSESLTALLNAV